MLLTIDIGNTNIVFGVYDQGTWLNHWRIQTDPLKTSDEYEVIFRSLINSGQTEHTAIRQIILSSVVPSLLYPFNEMLKGLFGEARITTVSPDIYKYLPVKVLNPYEIGADLVANSVAAHQKYGKLTMVIDFGTALTFTTIGADSEIRGVAIAPGLGTAVDALAGKTAQLPQIHLSPPPSVLGENTIHAIQSGVVLGFTGLVESIIARTEKELKQKLTVVATGGLSPVITPLTSCIDKTEPMLTLEGLALINTFLAQ